jgi:hypothetical protein
MTFSGRKHKVSLGSAKSVSQFVSLFRNRRFWSSLHDLGWIGAISQVTLN